jgi:hypothetical protein
MAKFDLLTTLSLETAGFTNGIKQVQATMGSFTSTVNMVGGAIGVAFGVKAIVGFGIECIKLAGEAEGIQNAFKAMGGNTTKVLESLRESTRGTISDMGLEQIANKAASYNVPMQQLTLYLKYATEWAMKTGQSVDEMGQKMAIALGRNMVRSYVALGISANECKKELAEFGNIDGLIQRKLSEMGDVVDTARIKIEKMKANVTNLKVAWGEFLVNSGAVQGALEGTALTLKRLADPNLDFAQKWLWSGEQYLKFLKGFKEELNTFGLNTKLENMQGGLPSVEKQNLSKISSPNL